MIDESCKIGYACLYSSRLSKKNGMEGTKAFITLDKALKYNNVTVSDVRIDLLKGKQNRNRIELDTAIRQIKALCKNLIIEPVPENCCGIKCCSQLWHQ